METRSTPSAPIDCILVMPAYNEEECVEGVVRAWHTELEKTVNGSFRLVVVNDGSRDRTGALLDELAKSLPNLVPVHQKNGGHGAALYTGYNKAIELGSRFVFQTDSDDQFLSSDFAKLWAQRETSPFLLGNRLRRFDPLHRLVITRIMRTFLFFIFGAWLVDANIPFRLIRTDYLRRLLARLPSGLFAPNIFLTVLAARDGRNLGHIPVTHIERATGEVTIVRWKLIKVCLRSARELFLFRLSLFSAPQLPVEASAES